MKRGIVIGKFMPVHKGHLALIEYAARHCDELLVVVGSRPEEPIPGSLRFRWMKEIFTGRKNIQVVSVRKDLPQDKEPSRRASRIWAQYLTGRFGKFDLTFSSEIYGDYLAEYMGAKSMIFDLERKQVPVSGTRVREHPFAYWEFIPENVRPYFVKRICVYGPESCGKTTMAEYLARYYGTVFVPEYARTFIEKRNNKFSYEDMSGFVRGQKRAENTAAREADKIMFCDTNALTTKIYSEYYFGKVSRQVRRYTDAEHYDFYLFMDIDIPWQRDPLRDAGHLREKHRELFLQELERRQLPYAIITGVGEERRKNAVRSVDAYLKTLS